MLTTYPSSLDSIFHLDNRIQAFAKSKPRETVGRRVTGLTKLVFYVSRAARGTSLAAFLFADRKINGGLCAKNIKLFT